MTIIIQMGETLRKATQARVAAASSQVHQLVQPFRAMSTAGTRISATATGRMPWKMRLTISLSLKLVKNIAMSRMMRNDGITAPTVATMLPLIPLTL